MPPRGPQDALKTSQEATKTRQEAPKSAPRRAQDAPKTPPRRSKTSRRRSRRLSRAAKMTPKRLQDRFSRILGTKMDFGNQNVGMLAPKSHQNQFLVRKVEKPSGIGNPFIFSLELHSLGPENDPKSIKKHSKIEIKMGKPLDKDFYPLLHVFSSPRRSRHC